MGSAIGYAMVVYGLLESGVLARILASWVASSLCSIALAYTLQKLMTRLFRNFLDDTRFLRTVSFSLITSLCFSAYSFGGNDVGNATGVYVAVTQEVAGFPINDHVHPSGFWSNRNSSGRADMGEETTNKTLDVANTSYKIHHFWIA